MCTGVLRVQRVPPSWPVSKGGLQKTRKLVIGDTYKNKVRLLTIIVKLVFFVSTYSRFKYKQ